MRRASDGAMPVTGSRQSLRGAIEAADPEAIIGVLEPLATPKRCERLQSVLEARMDAVTLVLDAPHDPHNGAAVLRSCDAFGVASVHVLERHEPFVASGAVAKGSERWVDVFGYRRADALLAALGRSDHQLVATHPEGRLDPADLAGMDRVALVIGNEHSGIGDDLLSACRERVRVPMRGFVESLNLSVTAAILLCFATAQRAGDLPARRRRTLYARGLVQTVPRARDILLARGIDLMSPPSPARPADDEEPQGARSGPD